eukprot:TRINITY_DN3327_c0_g1_i1.p1 TRINITY_DN3327_c0_g1~~TRINITY_DN3327_c0_g1_i1.p1  ORF type:complete len:215 (+),score=75.09 TRINITY_DN3327_c0_g1_i1:150-794(+)
MDWLTEEHMTGTTIMAVQFDGGVVMGADSRSTTGSYVANRVTDKIEPVSDFIFCCRSGSAADTQAIAGFVRYYLELHKVEIGEQPTVKTAAALFNQFCYNNKAQLMAGIIVAGWHPRTGGEVYTINLGGGIIKQPVSIGGSGSSYIYGFCDTFYRPNMTKEECEQFVIKAISLAMYRDGSSGGVVRTAVIDSTGITRRMTPSDQLPKPSDYATT